MKAEYEDDRKGKNAKKQSTAKTTPEETSGVKKKKRIL